MNNQKKIIFVVIVFVVGIMIFLFFKNQLYSLVQRFSANKSQTGTNSSQFIAVQNCGEVINTSDSNSKQKQDNIVAYTCMSQAMTTCSPATITEPYTDPGFLPGTNRRTFEILPINNNYCPVSRTISNLPTSKIICNIPLDFISAMSQFLQTKNQSGMLFYSIPFFFVSSSTPISAKPIVKNPLTNQSVMVQCNYN